jgi:hypothetical protein
MWDKSKAAAVKLSGVIQRWLRIPLRPVLRIAKMFLPSFIALSVIVLILEYAPWRFMSEITSESSCIAFELKAIGEQALSSFVTSIDCREVRLWAPHIEFGSRKPIALNAAGPQSWILFKQSDASPIIVREISFAPGTEIVLDMEDDQLTIRFSNLNGNGGRATLEVADTPSEIRADGWQGGDASTEGVRQQVLTANGGGVFQVEGLRMLRLTVSPKAFSEKNVFARFISVTKLRFNQNTRNEWQPVTKGEVRFRQLGDLRVQLGGDHLAIPSDAQAVLTNLTLSPSSIHAEATTSIASLLVGKAPSLVTETCPSLLDSILKTKLVALVVLFGGWLMGAIGGSTKLLEGLAKSDNLPNPPL